VQHNATAPASAATGTPAGPAPRPDALTRARRTVDPVLRAAVATLPAAMARIAAYHFGWQDAAGNPAHADPGKAIRPALVLAAARAHGATPDTAARAAAAVELVHNFTLLHDDVMDRDTTRRHRPTAWRVFGVPDAILAGDALHSLALRMLAEDPHPAGPAAAARLARCVAEICEGQHDDCAFETRTSVALEECLRMAEAKTGALLGCACALGALYALAPDTAATALDGFGRRIGLAFQLADDLIGIWGDPRVTGKPAGADLAARKKSLPVVAALATQTPDANVLAKLYRTAGPLTPGQIERAAEAVDRAGGRDWAQAQAADFMADAVARLALAVPDPDAADDLLTLAELATRRDH
jgi:geranylgeranyl diphosphate synthase type I